MKLRPDMVMREYGRLFPPHIKDRGRQLLADGLLDPVRVEETGFASVAHGERDYEVAIYQGDLLCECSYFEDTGACKHLFALLLAIDEMARKDPAFHAPPHSPRHPHPPRQLAAHCRIRHQ